MMKKYSKMMSTIIAIALLSAFSMQSYAGAAASNASQNKSATAAPSSEKAAEKLKFEKEVKVLTEQRIKRTAIVQLVLDVYTAEYDTHAKIRNAELKEYAVATPAQQVKLEEKRRLRERKIAERIARKIYSTATTQTDEDRKREEQLIDIVQLIGEIYIAEIYVKKEMHKANLKEYAAATPEQKEDWDQYQYEQELDRAGSIVETIYYENDCEWTISCEFMAAYHAAPLLKKIQEERKVVAETKKERIQQLGFYRPEHKRGPATMATDVEKYAELEIRKDEQEAYDAATPAEKLRIDKERLDRDEEDRIGKGSLRQKRKAFPSYCDGDKVCIANQKAYAAASFSQKLQMEKKRRLIEREQLKQKLSMSSIQNHGGKSHSGGPPSYFLKDMRAVAVKTDEGLAANAAAIKERRYGSKQATWEKRLELVERVLDAYIPEFSKYTKIRNAELKAYAVATPAEQVKIEEKRLAREREIAKRIARKIYSAGAPTTPEEMQLEKERIETVRLIGEVYAAGFYLDETKRPAELKKYAAANSLEKAILDRDRADKESFFSQSIERKVYPEYHGERELSCIATLNAYNAETLFKKIQLEKEDFALAYCRFNESELYERAFIVETHAQIEVNKAEKEKYAATTPSEKIQLDKKRFEREKEENSGRSKRIMQKIDPKYCEKDEICLAYQKAYATATFPQQLQMETNRLIREREKLTQTLIR